MTLGDDWKGGREAVVLFREGLEKEEGGDVIVSGRGGSEGGRRVGRGLCSKGEGGGAVCRSNLKNKRIYYI